MILGPGDAAENRARGELLGVQPHAAHDLLDDALLIVLVVDGKGASESLVAHLESFNVAAQNAHAERVESGDQRLGQRGVAQQPVNALAHLAGGLVGEGDGQNRVGRDAFLLDEPGDAAGDDAGFAGPRPGKNEKRALGSLNGGSLFGIQVGEERLQGEYPGGKLPLSSVPFGTVDAQESGSRREGCVSAIVG